ncbi:MAG: PEP-utilizing enzyme [Alcanivoracaceae bacterium]|nr:PEP-utilizing enzyme [Alcanivoracaceae bacterium]
MTAIERAQPDHPELPYPPAWWVRREAVEDSADDLVERLAALAGEGEHYWVLHQGPANPQSVRQVLANLDTDAALAAALRQLFSHPNGPASVLVQCLPRQVAAGLLFTRHPMRPDLTHVVVEGRAGEGGEPERLILHEDGRLAFHSGRSEMFSDSIGSKRFIAFANGLKEAFDAPRAGEWVWDGEQLWLIQALPVGTLPAPEEAWTRRAGLGLANQAISPLWYTVFGRWLKTAFWRPLGAKAGWQSLDNIEPYRRQHSHLYTNSQFLRALQEWQGDWSLAWALPPAWRPRNAPAPRLPGKAKAIALAARSAFWQWRLGRLIASAPGQEDDALWLRLMRLDRLGESLTALEGELVYQRLPAVAAALEADIAPARDDLERMSVLLGLSEAGNQDTESAARQLPLACAGADPVWPRFAEQPADLGILLEQLTQLPSGRRDAVRAALENDAVPPFWLRLRRQVLNQRVLLAGAMRELLGQMAQRLVARKLLRHPDDVHFLYFDELWQCWQGQARKGLAELIGERKVRYLSDAHAGPADWVLDQVGYGASSLGQTAVSALVNGYGLVPGHCRGRVQRLSSGWQLNQVRAGDVLVIDQSDPGWLPWVALAGAVIFCHRDATDDAVRWVRSLGIPAVWGVDDALHSLVDDVIANVDGDSGVVTWEGEVDVPAESDA